MKELNVIKWGGENAGMLCENNEVLRGKGFQRAIVVSAIRSDEFNTTSKLQEIGDLLCLRGEGYEAGVQSIIQQLQDFHLTLLSSQDASNSILKQCKILFQDLEDSISTYIKTFQEEKVIPSPENDYTISYVKNGKQETLSLIGWGEYISAHLNAIYLGENQGIDIPVLSDLGEDKYFYDNVERIGGKIHQILGKNATVFVSGYLRGTGNNILSTIGRGYSDATASLIAVSMKKKGFDTDLSIEKMVEGFLSADPRIVKNTKLIEELNYLLAKEIITERGPAAKLLHPESLNRRIQEENIPVRVYNPFSSSRGTTISSLAEKMPKGIFYIGGVEDIETLTYSSGRLDVQGFIANTSAVLANAGVNIKEAFGSATEQSYGFSFSSETSIQKMLQEMKQQYGLTDKHAGEYVKHQKNYSLIYCVGNMKDVVGTLHNVTGVCKENTINIKAIAQGLQQRAIVIVVERSDYKKAIHALHELI